MIMGKPKIRFRGFNDDWEQRKLRSVAHKTYGGGTPKTSEEEFWNGTIPWFQSADLIEHEVQSTVAKKAITELGLQKSAAQLIPGNSIAIVTRVGVGKLTFMAFPYATSQDFLSLSELNIDERFGCYAIYRLLQREKNFTQGTSIKGITKDELLNKIIDIPNREEQQKIGRYFTALDHLITLHQRKCEETNKIKKYMLQNMFPQDGEKTPKIRFEGFTDDWEQRKLGEFGKATGGTSIESEFVEEGNYKVISIGSYSETSKYNDQGLRTNKTSKTESKILNKDDLTMILNDKTAAGNIIGRVLLVDADNSYVYNQRTERIEVYKKKFEPSFLYQLLNAENIRSKIIKASQGNTQIYVNWSTISELKYPIPRVKSEQKKIATFFNNLDNLITLHQRKRDELQNLKKFMLQNMFV